MRRLIATLAGLLLAGGAHALEGNAGNFHYEVAPEPLVDTQSLQLRLGYVDICPDELRFEAQRIDGGYRVEYHVEEDVHEICFSTRVPIHEDFIMGHFEPGEHSVILVDADEPDGSNDTGFTFTVAASSHQTIPATSWWSLAVLIGALGSVAAGWLPVRR